MRRLCAMVIDGSFTTDQLLALFADDATVSGTGSAPCPCSGKDEIRRAMRGNQPDFAPAILALGANAQDAAAMVDPARPGVVRWPPLSYHGSVCPVPEVEMHIVADKIVSLEVNRTPSSGSFCSRPEELPATGSGSRDNSPPMAVPSAVAAIGCALEFIGIACVLRSRRARR